MDHRYGRHGPHAWLRWYKRHYRRPTTVPVPVVQSTTVIYVYTPSETERIIYIVATPSSNFGEPEETEERAIVTRASRDIGEYLPGRNGGEIEGKGSLKISPGLQGKARRDAVDDLDELEILVESGKYVLINREGIIRRGRAHAKRRITDDDLDMSVSYEEQRRDYQQVYQSRINEDLPRFAGQIVEITDEREKQLRDILNRDREILQSRSSGDWDAHDLVLTRLLRCTMQIACKL